MSEEMSGLNIELQPRMDMSEEGINAPIGQTTMVVETPAKTKVAPVQKINRCCCEENSKVMTVRI
ncbi:type VI secretion system-associated protein [Sesbania bispinosa]|nr:type VI secretion system-associated protein [Sesbania bispinosa]